MVVKISDVFEEMVKHFNPAASGGTNASYQFEILGPDGGTWALKIQQQKCELVVGGVPSPSVTISLSDKDWMSIREGKLNSQMAFMQGKLKIKGDMNLAMKLQTMFPIS
jgi:putative sterol carrier protein